MKVARCLFAALACVFVANGCATWGPASPPGEAQIEQTGAEEHRVRFRMPEFKNPFQSAEKPKEDPFAAAGI